MEGRKRRRGTSTCGNPAGDLACNPGMCPDCEWNQRLFGSHADAQSTEPHHPGLRRSLRKIIFRVKPRRSNKG